VVDRLLQSPRFGEKWARHWLDVVRYAESTGRAWNAPYIYAFRYRDWVIDSFNADKPYTRFVAEQIAGDLLPAKTDAEKQQNLIATGMLAMGSLDLQALQYDQFLLDRVDDQIDVITRALHGADHCLRALPRSQDRPRDAARLLCAGRLVHEQRNFLWHGAQGRAGP